MATHSAGFHGIRRFITMFTKASLRSCIISCNTLVFLVRNYYPPPPNPCWLSVIVYFIYIKTKSDTHFKTETIKLQGGERQGVPRKKCPLLFLSKYLSLNYEYCTVWTMEWSFDSTPCFSTKTLSTSRASCQQGTWVCMPSQYHALSCSCSPVLNAQITLTSVPNLILRTASFRAPNSCISEGDILRLQGGWVQISWWIPESSNFSAAL